jgi:D-alanyl-D-alanine carboxypeptidase
MKCSALALPSLAWLPLFVCLSLCLVGFGPPALLPGGQDSSGTAITASTLAHVGRANPPTVQASSVALVDGDNGTLIWGKAPHQAWAPASMTKMMTALVALQAGHLDQLVTSDVDAAKMTGDSVMGLHPGERLSLHDLLYGLLVPSGDDAAIVIAEAVGGNQPAFVAQMNQEGTALGLTDTHFVNPHGLDANGHVSSPYDMIVIARAAMRFPLFRQIVATPQITIQGKWVYPLTNTNPFLGRRPGVVGIKTGHTDNALSAITVAQQQNGHLLYLTVMHSPDFSPDVAALLDYFAANDQWVTLALPTSPLNQLGGPQPQTLAVATDEAVYLPSWQAAQLAVQVDPEPDAALRATDNPDLPPANAGAATFSAAGAPIARLPLVAR